MERASFGEYARSRGVTRPYISKLSKSVLASAIVTDEAGRRWIDRTTADAILMARGDPGRRAGSRERKARSARSGGNDSAPASEIDTTYQAARVQALNIENARRLEKLKREQGQSIEREVSGRFYRDLGAGFGRMIERYPDRIATQVAAQLGVDAHKCRTLLVAMAHELRDEFEKLVLELPERLGATEQ
jgi:hypothetical protein